MAKNRRNIKTKAIALLTREVIVGEHLQSSTAHHTGKNLDERTETKAENVESKLIQIVQEVSQGERECA